MLRLNYFTWFKTVNTNTKINWIINARNLLKAFN